MFALCMDELHHLEQHASVLGCCWFIHTQNKTCIVREKLEKTKKVLQRALTSNMLPALYRPTPHLLNNRVHGGWSLSGQSLN